MKDLTEMPKCPSCNKVFEDWQALGNHMKKHFNDSDEDIPLLNQLIHRISQNLVNCKRVHFEQDSYNSQKRVTFDADESVEKSDFDIPFPSYLNMTDVNTNECVEYNDLFAGMLTDARDIYQEFLKEYMKFMHMITRFHI
ncbi:6844_t:CDS:2 [Funneliformis caledonium]|uniref:6844_t:CDS:1 n=1 Tax=Funneliformis caledonium TaxID=1117310 RepID=A0A9N9DR24_9GLOM|nr:6844_t:CDS:2 [Funneliformis caledonium]